MAGPKECEWFPEYKPFSLKFAFNRFCPQIVSYFNDPKKESFVDCTFSNTILEADFCFTVMWNDFQRQIYVLSK